MILQQEIIDLPLETRGFQQKISILQQKINRKF